jgi:ABC-type nitrate/sulfonate/bicarbonate transport system substrate-binding protein
MKIVDQAKTQTKTTAAPSRRNVLMGGAALGMAGIGLASGLGTRRSHAQAAKATVNVVNAAGSLSIFQTLLFKELKLFDKYGVSANVINVSDGSKILAGLISGDGDICGGSGTSGIFPAIEKGAKIKILSGAGIAPLSILYSNKPEIRSVKDLVGKTVGTGAVGANLHQLVVAVLRKHGVDPKAVKFANIGGTGDIFKALVGGAIDAGVAPIEFSDTAEKYKLYPLTDGKFYEELPTYTNQAIYSSERAIAEKRDGLVRVMAAYADLFRWMSNSANKDAFIKYYLQALGSNASTDEAAFFQKFLSQPNRLATDLVLTEDKLKLVQDLNLEFGAQKARLPFSQVADMSLAQEALKLVKA